MLPTEGANHGPSPMMRLPTAGRAMKPAMMGLIGPMGLLIATLMAVAKASSGGSPSGGVAGGSKNRTGGTASTGTGSNSSGSGASKMSGSIPRSD
jgi:hypothetical protein